MLGYRVAGWHAPHAFCAERAEHWLEPRERPLLASSVRHAQEPLVKSSRQHRWLTRFLWVCLPSVSRSGSR